jgi:MFS family permease
MIGSDTRKPGMQPVVMVSLATALSLLGDSMLYIALPLHWQEAGLDSLWQVGALLAINRLVRLPINPLIGLLYQRISLRTGLLLAVLLGAISTCGYGWAQGFVAWLLLRALWGVAWSLFRIGGLTAVVRCAEPCGQGHAIGLYNGLYRLGSLFGMLLGGLLVAFIGLPALAWAFGLLSLLGLPLLLFGFNLPAAVDVQPRTTETSGSRFGSRGRSWPVMFTGLVIALLIQGIFASTLSALIGHYQGVELELFGLLLSATAAAGVLQALRWAWEPWLARRIGRWSDKPQRRLPLLVGALLLGAASFAPMALSLPLSLWLLVALLALLAATALTTLGDALAAETASRLDAVRFMTRYSIGQDLGAACGPLLAYILFSLTGGFGWLYASGSLLFALLAGYWWYRSTTGEAA